MHDIFDAEPSNFVYNLTKWEGFCVKLIQTRPYVKQYTICNVYRPPYEGADDFELFNKEFTDFLNIISTTGQSFICGDFNINLLKILTKPNYNTFFESMLAHGFFPKITLPTRICDTSSTLIDQIYTNVLNNKDKSGIFTTHISDHQAIFTAINVGLMGFSEKKFITVETKDDVSLNKFIDELKTGDIIAKMDHDVNADSNSNYKILAEQLQYAKEKHLPTRKLKFNKYKHKQQKWVTNGILKSIKTKNKLYRTLQQTKTEDVEVFELIKIRFLRFRKILRQSINEAKRSYFHTTFERFKHAIKQTWSVIDETLRRKKKETLSPTFLHNGRTLNDPQEIANAFNTYFTSIGPKLATQY